MGSPVTQFEIEPPDKGQGGFQIEPPDKPAEKHWWQDSDDPEHSVAANSRRQMDAEQGAGAYDRMIKSRDDVHAKGFSTPGDLNVSAWGDAGPGQVAEGAKDIAHGEFSRGAHRVISGGMNTVAPMAVFPAVAAPVATGVSMAAGYLGGKAARGIAGFSGLTEDQQDLAEDVGNLAGGYAGAKVGSRVTPALKSGARATGEFMEENAPAAGRAMAHPVRTLAGAGTKLALRSGGRLLQRMAGPEAPKVGEFPAAEAQEEPLAQAESESSAPYRLKGSQITDAKTVTPRRILGPDRQLPPHIEGEAPVTQGPRIKATDPTKAHAEILKNMGVSAPKATLKPIESIPGGELAPSPEQSFAGTKGGESAIQHQLTKDFGRSGINQLRAIAQQRGIKVQPGATHGQITKQIMQTVTPEEIESFQQAAVERQQPDYSVKGSRLSQQSNGESPVNIEDTLRKSIEQVKAKKAAAGQGTGEQGGHAGGGVSSVEELNRPGNNYVVSKGGKLTYHGKSFDPGSTPEGSTHVTVLPDGSFRVNAGQKLTPDQTRALTEALK